MSDNKHLKSKCEEYLLELDKINNSDLSLKDKYISVKQILERLCMNITIDESLQFSSLFSRIVFICNKYGVLHSLQRKLHAIRILSKDKKNEISDGDLQEASKALRCFISIIYDDRRGESPLSEEITSKGENTNYVRIEIVEIDAENKIIAGIADNTESSFIKVRCNVVKFNSVFNPTFDLLWIGAQLNLINNRIDDDGFYIPDFIVLEPDYLLDASALAECFQNYSCSHLLYFKRKFELPKNSKHILLGNLANYFLDELVSSENRNLLLFEDVILKAFKDKPYEFATCRDIENPDQFRAFYALAKTQFENIKRVINYDFPKNEIDIRKCTLEPSFFCEKYGVQGRLDLLSLSEDDIVKCKIIELKSGILPFPKNDPGKITLNHEVQIAIYRLIVQSVFNIKPENILPSILYSSSINKGENLRFAPQFIQLEKEIINLRNLIVANEYRICQPENVSFYFKKICDVNNYGKVPDFFATQITNFEDTLKRLSELEKKYFFRFISFISRELFIQKTGKDTYYCGSASTADLWNTDFEDRLSSYNLLNNLTINNIIETNNHMKIICNRYDSENFVNFREGDTCILYPKSDDFASVLKNQVFKGNIERIEKDKITLTFRYKQQNKSIFEKYNYWVVEHDNLDHTYNFMYKSLFSFCKSSIEKRQLLLGLKEPVSDFSITNIDDCDIEETKNKVLKRAISAKDYFLIIGPPGTGKTSVYAKELIKYYYENTDNNLLIIAYTNRAVDELCEAINDAFHCKGQESDHYIRIGTELSCGERFRHRLLQKLSANVNSRKELNTIINKHRIIVGTLASVCGKQELFDIKKFNVSIIDEASQILEPQIIGILPKVDKFILIGDHKQLSTITLQSKGKSKVNDTDLNNVGLYACDESLFERLYRQCLKNDWNHVYDTLFFQGRMHEDLSHFSNEYFYKGILRPIADWQSQSLDYRCIDQNNYLKKLITENRLLFFDSSKNEEFLFNSKINIYEAEIITRLCLNILDIYKENNKIFDSQTTLGIITPYRNQIALIKEKLQDTGVECFRDIMIDTIERFQGSQRDIIIISFCINLPYQLEGIVNMDHENEVDRKLNVALTRARKQMFITGNSHFLNKNKIYNFLIKHIGHNISLQM